jgi:hypothetical protein
MEAWKLRMEPWRVFIPVIADSHHLNEEQDPHPHDSEKMNPDPHLSDADPQPHGS